MRNPAPSSKQTPGTAEYVYASRGNIERPPDTYTYNEHWEGSNTNQPVGIAHRDQKPDAEARANAWALDHDLPSVEAGSIEHEHLTIGSP